jgi:lysozyme
MKARHQASRTAIELIKSFEGYRRSAARLADGRWTIGYGHTLTAREGAEVNESDAEALLIYDLLAIAGAVNDLTYTPLTQNQFDALCSFAFNIGLEAFHGSSTLRLVNEGALLQAAHSLEAWRKAEFEGEAIVVDALIRRRAAEKTLFLTPEKGFVAAPSAVVTPKLDTEAVFAEVVDVRTPLDGEAAIAIPTAVELGAVEAQDELPMALAAEPATVAEPAPQDAAPPADETDALQGVLSEVLYEIPGYGVESEFHPADSRLEKLSLLQLILIGAGGLALLVAAYYLLMRGSAAAGLLKIGFNAAAALAGLGGAVGVFASIYQILNRFDRPE